jgi:hypothetical protein
LGITSFKAGFVCFSIFMLETERQAPSSLVFKRGDPSVGHSKQQLPLTTPLSGIHLDPQFTQQSIIMAEAQVVGTLKIPRQS